MRVNKIRKLLLIVTTFVLSGCYGIGAGTFGTSSFFEPATEDFGILQGKNEIGSRSKMIEDPDIKQKQKWPGWWVKDGPYTKEEILRLWGEPDQTYSEGSCEVLSYHDGVSWAGVFAFLVVIPVPLALPTGLYENKFYLKEGTSVGMERERLRDGYLVGYFCGDNECGFTAKSASSKTEHSPIEWCR
jgi:hypothetical protein